MMFEDYSVPEFIYADLDETVLDNSQYQINLFNRSEEYNPKSWNKWVKREEAKLVPGSKDFILRYKKRLQTVKNGKENFANFFS